MTAEEAPAGWRRWLTANSSIVDIADRRTVELVAFLVGVMTVMSTAMLLVVGFIAPAWAMQRLPVVLGLIATYAVLFAVNRTKHHRLAATLLAIVPLAFNSVVGLTTPDDPLWFGFMPVSVILAGALLPLRRALAVGLLSIAATALVVIVHAHFALMHGVILVGYVTLMVAITLGTARFRGRVERERLEEVQRLASQLAATERLESIGRLAGGVAHDFNNLLTVILASADLARRGRDVPKLIDAIDDAATRAAALTKQLLAFTRSRTSVKATILLDELLRGMQPLLRRLVPENVELVLALGSTWAIDVDESQLEQVILNLAANARDAMADGGRLTLTTSEAAGVNGADAVRLAVADTGTGMDTTTRSRAFEPFFSTKPAHAGTGLGLATVAANIQQAGGTVELTSAKGAGTTVTITLPRSKQQPSHKVVAAPQVRTHARGVVLLVEDDPEVRSTTERILRDLGLTVVVAASAAEIARAIKEAPGALQLVVSDVVMPGKSGLAVLAELRATQPDLPAVLISGYSEEDVAAAADQANTRFVGKPFTSAALVAAVNELLSERGVAADAS